MREYGVNGLRNAIHFMVVQPQQTLFEYLLSLKIDPDVPDYDEVTPFTLLSATNIDPERRGFIDKFIDIDVRVDYPDINKRTAFLNYYEKS